ncbi:MAG: Lpg1974 family pore-forming outer membrane protein [Candidatus Algichlamydia australiensis]|nr:Lpg1974 family pore-forming outer membrane protein [Chlamydiales bacterium]
MKFVVLALGIALASASAEEITLQDILSIKEQIRQDREQIAELKEHLRGSEQDRDVDILELKAVLTHQEEEIAQLNQEIAKAKKEKQSPANKTKPMGCAPKPACPPDPCCEPVCCPKVYKPLPPPCQRCPMAMRYHPAIDEESQFAARGEFLIWKTAANPLDYALPKQVNETGVDTGAIGPYEVLDYDWDPAFRLALQYRFCPDFWQAEVQYTYLSNSGSDSVNGGSNPNPAAGEAFLTGTFIQETGEALSRASASIDFDYHVLDFYLARRFLLAESIIFKFLFGASGAWINQDLDVRYTGFDIASSRTTNNWKYNAGGIKAGITNDWFLGKGFGIYSQLVLGGFIGNWKGDARNTSIDTTGTSQTLENWTYEDTRFALTTQFQLGLSWHWLFENISLRLFAGYEMNPWININDIRASSLQDDTRQRFSRIHRGLICPQGVTLNAQVGF